MQKENENNKIYMSMEKKNLMGATAQKPEVQSEFDSIIVKIGVLGKDLLKYRFRKNGYVVLDLDENIYLKPVLGDDHILRVVFPDGNWFNVVKNHSVGSKCNWKYVTEQVRQIMCTHYNVPTPDGFPTFNDWAEDLYEYGYCSSEKRWDRFHKLAMETAPIFR